MMRPWCVSALCLALLAAVLPGCGRRPAAPAEKVLAVGNRSEVQDLDPHLVSGIAEHRALSSLFEGLATLDLDTMEPVPAAAARWEISEDQLRYTFHLRAEARWSNGDPLTAEDFVYSWRRMLHPALAAEYAYLLHCLKNGRAYNEGLLDDPEEIGVRAVDAATLEVRLESPTPYFLSMQTHFAWFPVHRATIEKFGKATDRGSAWTRSGNHVSNGPFRLLEWRPDEVLRVTRNEHYWGAAAVKLDGIAFYPISNELTEERSFRSGSLHLTYTVPMFKIPEYQRAQPELLRIHPYLQTYYYRFNCTRAPFTDARVRRAFSLAIERDALVRNVLKAGEAPAHCFVPPNTAGYNCGYQVPYDLAEARRLLAEAGYPEGRGLPPLDLLYNTAETDKIIAEALQQMWKEKLGAEVRLFNQEYKVYLASMSQLDYAIARSTWLADVLDPVNFLECFLSASGNNRTGYASVAYDSLIMQAYAETDRGKRHALLQEAERMLLEEAVIAPVFFKTQTFLQSPRVRGLRPNVLGLFHWQDLDLAAN
jgi:oligopeptide transport system substrate-binding protein